MATRMEYPNASCFDRIKPDTTSYFENSCPNMCNTLDHCEPFKTNSTRGHCFCPGKDHHWQNNLHFVLTGAGSSEPNNTLNNK